MCELPLEPVINIPGSTFCATLHYSHSEFHAKALTWTKDGVWITSQKRQIQNDQKQVVTAVQKEHEWTILFTEEMEIESVNQSCEKRKCN